MNNITIVGRLTRDPETRTNNNGNSQTRFTVAVDRGKKKGGEDLGTDFIPVSFWGKQGEVIQQYFKKGSAIAVIGALRIENYTDKDGNKKTWTDIQGNHFEFVERKSTGGGGGESAPANNAPAQQDAPSDSFSAADDDMPF